MRGLKIVGKAFIGGIVAALALAALSVSCAQDVKITAPRYALVYGVQNYLHVSPLKYTQNDATEFSHLLANQGWTTKLALDSDAERADIVTDISYLASTVEPGSTVLFYFSGHGALTNDGASGLIGPYDTDFLASSGLIDESTVISAPQLASMLAALPTKNVIVIFDSCNSGGFVESGSEIDASPQDYSSMPSFSAFSAAMSNFGYLLSSNAAASGEKAPIVISAAGRDESSYDGSLKMLHGVFTYYLLKAASAGDANGDGVVTTTEAFSYTQEAIRSWGSSLPTPEFPSIYYAPFLPHISGGVRDLVLFTN